MASKLQSRHELFEQSARNILQEEVYKTRIA